MRGLHMFHPARRRCLPSPSAKNPSLRPSLNSPPVRFLPPNSGRAFSTTPQPWARRKKNKGDKPDMRLTLIRYHLKHPLTPRPLRFSRNRTLRHWTIHRAWQLHRAKLREAREKELERQFHSMREACEALRLIGEDGLAISEPGSAVPPPGARDLKTLVVDQGGEKVEVDVEAAAERQKDIGKLYRMAMMKTGTWDGVPIEYARIQTDTPSRSGWDTQWTR